MDQFTQNPAANRLKRRSALVAILLGSSLAMLGAGAMSLAVFTDSRASTGSWTTGTIVLGVSPSTAFSATNILPGSTGSADITVSNTGTGALRYAVSTSATNTDAKGLAAQMTLTVTAGTCASLGSTLYTGALGSAALGSPTQGAQAGDRSVAAASSDALCFAWSFPLASGNAFQGAATTATFTFAAEQTTNNP
ncbi:MAG: TasA family protein [Candidatus Limnocylindrales bacterium]